MPVIETHLLRQNEVQPGIKQIYNGLDCCLTVEVFEEINLLFNQEPEIYGFERALQAPALAMMLRGFKIDEYERRKGAEKLTIKINTYNDILQELAHAVWGKPLNPRSSDQLKDFFYNHMALPEQWSSQKGVRKLSMNRETLEKLELYLYARPIIACILSIREHRKVLEVLETQIDADGRFRCSINIAGTETGRFSTSASATGTGSNAQNLKRDDDIATGAISVRKAFISDDGYKLVNIDLEQTESRDVGFLHGSILGDWRYLDACEAGDLHTQVCKLVWPKLGWTGNNKRDRALAETPFYRHFTHRDMGKRGGHLTNYYGTAWTASRHLKVPLKIMEDFQKAYVEQAFPAFPLWWRWVAEQLQTTSQAFTTPYGRQRHFFGRDKDDTTLREAIAFVPQSCTADRMNLGLWRIWKHMRDKVDVLMQVHDSVCFQFPEHLNEADIIAEALELIKVPLKHGSRVMIVPGEAKVGWNWGTYNEKLNPNGLRKWTGKDERKRAIGLDRVL